MFSLHSTHTVDWEQVQITTSYENMILLFTIEDRFPDFKHQLPPPIREYHQYHHTTSSGDSAYAGDKVGGDWRRRHGRGIMDDVYIIVEDHLGRLGVTSGVPQ